MQKSKNIVLVIFLVGDILLLTGLIQSMLRIQYLEKESYGFAQEANEAIAEKGELLQIIASQRQNDLKLRVLQNTAFGQCITKHVEPEKYCPGDPDVIQEYKKVGKRKTSTSKEVFQELLRNIALTNLGFPR